MRKDSKLSDVLHILLHMADHDEPLSSGHLAQLMGSNPVVVRRTLGGLRDNGLVNASKGRQGGWMLNCDLSTVTLLDVYQAVGAPTLFAIGTRDRDTTCLVESAVNRALEESLSSAEALLLERFGAVTLQTLSDSFSKEFAALKKRSQ